MPSNRLTRLKPDSTPKPPAIPGVPTIPAVPVPDLSIPTRTIREPIHGQPPEVDPSSPESAATNVQMMEELNRIAAGGQINPPACILMPVTEGCVGVCFEIPYAPPTEGYAARRVEAELQPRESIALARLCAALNAKGATLPDGRVVGEARSLAIRWLLNQVADALRDQKEVP